MTGFIKRILYLARRSPKRIAFADYEDDRLYNAIKRILNLGIAYPVIVGNSRIIREKLSAFKIKEEKVSIIDPNKDSRLESFRDEYYALRKHKGITLEQALEFVKQPHYFAIMLLYKDLVDGVVSGLSSKTKPFRPAFKVIKTREGVNRVSSVFIMDFKDKTLFFADCAVNIDPTPEELAEIAILTGKTIREFGFEPRIALLSFSTRSSAQHELVDKVKKATLIAKKINDEENLNFLIDGELQFDAAFVPEVYILKCPDSPLKGRANTFIFPDLDAGNIGYKLVERLAKAKAIGPILQGLKKPVNDISRGASYEDLVNITAITVIQAQNNQE